MGLAQIGEFSFIIATLGLTLEVTSAFLYPIAVAVSVITTLITPYLIRGDRRHGRLHRSLGAAAADAGALRLHGVDRLVRAGHARSPLVLLVRRMGWQLVINLLLTVGVFALGAWIADWDVRRICRGHACAGSACRRWSGSG